jgi:hypothetical protein
MSINAEGLHVGDSALIERRHSSFAEGVAQLRLGRFHLARMLMTEQDAAQLVPLIIARDKFFLRVGALKIDTSGQDAEVTDKIHPQIEDLRPEVGNFLVAGAFFARHVSAGDQALFTRVLPVRLAPHPTHQSVRIKCQVPDRIDSLFFRLEIVRDRRSMWSGQRRIAHEIEIRFCAAGDNSQTNGEPVAAFCLDIAQDGLALKAIETLAHRR